MKKNLLIKGTVASHGIVIGKALLVDHGCPDFLHYHLSTNKEIGHEVERFQKALSEKLNEQQLTKIFTALAPIINHVEVQENNRFVQVEELS